ncbi:unnamed protein product [Trypanosoma congolense IL3000]|uniref:WGS project CAEQ00000000 data, annotated contig 1913 n=1 Tax=Trypanosoma congolense (strain IL3000) TaxID=1068625 RepID=F9WA04_TRYCI|nr:unnamed protein product [Trypanosoma congolense IL3000]
MREVVDRLRAMGIISLHQWESAAAANEVEDVDACVRGVLNAALLSARRNEETIRVGDAPSGLDIDCVYESVFNARWSYVVKSDEYDKKWLGMGVLRDGEGEQPRLWSEAQADAPYDPEEPWEGDVVPGVSGKLVMAALKSHKGWPYTLFNASASEIMSANVLRKYKDVCNAHLHMRKENVRVWNIVKKNIDEWLTGLKKVHPFIVIGTPGIGKSFATGSLLLYQLLHYPSDDLKVVAYFVRGKAYIFHREGRRVVYYTRQQVAVDEIECMEKRGIKGYIIFDISGNSVHIGDLPYDWGIVLISSPNVKSFHEFAKQRQDTAPIYMNCYEDVEFKAAHVWDRHLRVAHNQIRFEDVNLENVWKVLGKRIYMVGPLPRYVLGDGECFRRRVADVNAALSRILDEDVNRYVKHLANKEEWYVDDTTNKIVKLVRVRSDWPEEPRYEAICTYVRGRILRKAMENFAKLKLSLSELVSRREWYAHKFEMSGVLAFTVGSVVTEVVRHLKYLPREGETEEFRSSVLARVSASGLLPTSVRQLCFHDKPVEIVARRLYKPAEKNFPVVDGFFLVDAGRRGSFVSRRSGGPHPNCCDAPSDQSELSPHADQRSGQVFRELMAQSFTNWTEMQSRLSYEIIYVQHADSTALTGRQRCGRSGVADDAGIEEFWNGTDQFLVKLEAPIVILLLQDTHNVATTEVTGGGERDARCDPEITTDAVGVEAQTDVTTPEANATTAVDTDRAEGVTGVARDVRDVNITTAALGDAE